MSIKVTIKLDMTKIRVYLKGNDLTINEIENYLKKQGYNNVDEYIKIEATKREQKASGYRVGNYSMAYRVDEVGNDRILAIEAWFKIPNHFTDKALATAIEDIVKPILPPIEDNVILPKPNMRVSRLEHRVYLTVFEQDNVLLDGASKLVQNFESVVQDVRRQVGLESDKIPSTVHVEFANEIPQAVHAKGLKTFGFMPAQTHFSSSAPKSAYNTTTLSNTF